MGIGPFDIPDPERRAMMRALIADNPGRARHGATWGWTQAALRAMPRARRTRWAEGPSAIFIDDADRSVDPAPVGPLAEALGAQVIRMAGGHDLFEAEPTQADRMFGAMEVIVGKAIPPLRDPGPAHV